jgi:histidine triad (HIT) family protein
MRKKETPVDRRLRGTEGRDRGHLSDPEYQGSRLDRIGGMSEHQPTIFDKILSGEIPSWKVYEDDHVFAFLDIGPLSDGHTLVIPKERKAQLHQLSDESAAAVGRVLPRLCRAVMRATGATAYNILQNNGSEAHQVVMHVHFHIIPKFGGEGLGILWPAGRLAESTARDLVAKMRAALEAQG